MTFEERRKITTQVDVKYVTYKSSVEIGTFLINVAPVTTYAITVFVFFTDQNTSATMATSIYNYILRRNKNN